MKEHEQKIYEDKVRFLINISHELRTPLTLIYAPLKRILKTMAHDNENYNALMKIYKQSGRMRELINMVLDIRKMETGANTLTYKLYDFNEWMSEVCEDFKDECAIQKVKLVIRKDNRIPEAAFMHPPSLSESRWGAWSVPITSMRPSVSAWRRAARSVSLLTAGLHLMRVPRRA